MSPKPCCQFRLDSDQCENDALPGKKYCAACNTVMEQFERRRAREIASPEMLTMLHRWYRWISEHSELTCHGGREQRLKEDTRAAIINAGGTVS